MSGERDGAAQGEVAIPDDEHLDGVGAVGPGGAAVDCDLQAVLGEFVEDFRIEWPGEDRDGQSIGNRRAASNRFSEGRVRGGAGPTEHGESVAAGVGPEVRMEVPEVGTFVLVIHPDLFAASAKIAAELSSGATAV